MGATDYFCKISRCPLVGLLLALACPAAANALEMPQMVIDAISMHPLVKEKIHIYRQVVSDRDIAESGWRPSVDLQASTGRYETESPATGNQTENYDSSTYEFSVTQNLFSGFDTTYQIEQTQSRIKAALYEVYDAADNIAMEAIRAYLEVIKQRRLLQLAQENVATHEEILAQIRDRNLSGVGRRSQLQQTEGRLARAQASLIAQQNNLQDAATQLHQILGRYVDPDSLSDPSLPRRLSENLDTLIDRALEDHPAMRVAESNIGAAQADHLRSLRTRYPKLDLKLATEHGDNIDGIEGNTDETSLVLNLTYNFYSGGRDQAERQKKVSAIYEQKESAARIRRQIINALRLSWTADVLLAKQLEFLQTHVAKAKETAESYREEFFIGQRDLVDLLDAESEHNSAQNQFAEAKYDSLLARYRVYEGIGHLFEASGVDFEVDQGDLRIARLQTNQVDKLPLPSDEDQDQEIDPMDHCDNTLPGKSVNSFGCMDDSAGAQGNIVPIVKDDVFDIETSGLLVITVAQLLANDFDANADTLQIIDVSAPEIGQLAYDYNGNLVYRPPEGFSGSDSFRYTVSDNRGGSAVATATVRLKVIEPKVLDLSKIQLVNFKYNETELTEISKVKVAQLIEQIKQVKDIKIEIYTYTDDIGSDNFNLDLSERRARALERLLVSRGIDHGNIKAIGMGEKMPIADNSTESGKAINRRGEFIFRAGSALQQGG